mmetsp:Transcript_32414/g.64346  ORF Transcript_32414/g.64346 Transcript_32414/m.64346 type:complete len:90 (-) Transcript_32414:4-273(-)
MKVARRREARRGSLTLEGSTNEWEGAWGNEGAGRDGQRQTEVCLLSDSFAEGRKTRRDEKKETTGLSHCQSLLASQVKNEVEEDGGGIK